MLAPVAETGTLSGTFLYNMVVAQTSAQATDISTLTGRAKDLIGAATISTTVTGALANANIVNVQKHAERLGVVWLLAVGFGLVFLAGFAAIYPREWSLAPDAERVASEVIAGHLSDTVDVYYAKVAMGFLDKGTGRDHRTAIQENARKIGHVRVLIDIQLLGLLLLAASGVVLASTAV
jgi:hypothetical protein